MKKIVYPYDKVFEIYKFLELYFKDTANEGWYLSPNYDKRGNSRWIFSTMSLLVVGSYYNGKWTSDEDALELAKSHGLIFDELGILYDIDYDVFEKTKYLWQMKELNII